MKIKWPWSRFELSIANLRWDIKIIKDALEEARVAKFVRVVDYKRGMKLNCDSPKMISLEDLEKRIEKLEKKI